jgi:hypothetical protein
MKSLPYAFSSTRLGESVSGTGGSSADVVTLASLTQVHPILFSSSSLMHYSYQNSSTLARNGFFRSGSQLPLVSRPYGWVEVQCVIRGVAVLSSRLVAPH